MMNVARRAYNGYSRCLKLHPKKANLVQGVSIFAAGDVISQQLQSRLIEKTGNAKQKRENRGRCLDGRSVLNSAALGGATNGVFLRLWYNLLDHRLGVGMTPGLVAGKVILDSLLFGSFSIVFYLGGKAFLNGKPFSEAAQQIRDNFWEGFKMEWKIWPLYNMFCFGVVPLHCRTLTTALISVIWTSFLSWLAQQDFDKDELNAPAPSFFCEITAVCSWA